MATIVFNVALGRIASLGALPAANDALIVIPLEASGLVADATMRDYPDVASLLAGATNEQTTMGRKTVTSPVVTINHTDNRVEVDIPDQLWAGATGNAVGALLVAYDPDTTGGTDGDLIPLTVHAWPVTPDGSDLTAVVADFFRASSAA